MKQSKQSFGFLETPKHRWPDGKQFQRVGLVPEIEVKPTIAGIRAGRDEVLERAVAFIQRGPR